MESGAFERVRAVDGIYKEKKNGGEKDGGVSWRGVDKCEMLGFIRGV